MNCVQNCFTVIESISEQAQSSILDKVFFCIQVHVMLYCYNHISMISLF